MVNFKNVYYKSAKFAELKYKLNKKCLYFNKYSEANRLKVYEVEKCLWFILLQRVENNYDIYCTKGVVTKKKIELITLKIKKIKVEEHNKSSNVTGLF